MATMQPAGGPDSEISDPVVMTSIDNTPICPHDDTDCPMAAVLAELRERIRQLEASSRIDALTGYYNYRHLMEALAAEMARTRRSGVPTSLIMTDLDHFKKINDSHGHEAGNAALKQAARIWHGAIRQVDMACRYGGEEFVFILPGTRFGMAVRAAERLREALTQAPVDWGGTRLVLSASFGVAAYNGKDDVSVEDLINRADQYVLKAKQDGRNRVAFDHRALTRQETSVSASEKALLARSGADNPDEAPE